MAKTNKEWSAEKRSYEKTATMLTGKPIRVKDVEPGCADEIGYTSSKGNIHLAYDHPMMNGLTKMEKVAFRKGVFAHETLHQIFTDFKYHEYLMKWAKPYEKNVLGIICNVLEDPAIENYASTVMGGNLLNCLKFSITHIYKMSPEINESETAMGQFIAALIHFGDMGLVKGHFTFPEAKSCFAKSAPIFYKGIHEPVGKTRLDLAKEIFEISRPLWEKEAEEQQKILDELMQQLESVMRGSGSGMDGNPDMLPEEDKKDKRRKITIKKISKEEYEEMKKNSSESSSEIPSEGDITVCICDEADEEEEKNSGGSSIPIPQKGNKSDPEENKSSSSGSGSEDEIEEENPEKGNSSEKSSDKKDSDDTEFGEGDSSDKNSEKNSEGKEKSEKNSEKETDGSSSDGSDEDSENKSDETNSDSKDTETNNETSSNNNPFRINEGNGDIKIKPDSNNSEEYDNEDATIDSDEYVLSQDDISYIKKEQEKEIKEYEAEEKEDGSDSSPLDDFAISSAALGSRSCLNYRVSFKESDRPHLEAAYEEVLTRLNSGIRNLTNQLKKIFQNDMEEKLYKGSGKVNLNRMNCGRVTSRVFDKRSAPVEKSDLAVILVIDESGSMSSRNKYISARESAIALAEVFHSLNIPIYVMGFTADTNHYDVVHNHYITWKNSKSDRLKLLNISARANNCDGYSIRYATKVMKKSKAKNKLMIVLSDGQPAANRYTNKGREDTKDAIREAKKTASVLGVAIGNNDTNIIHYMYEADFLHISNVNELFSGLSRKIKTLIRNWD